jgi:hypothetical protein
LLYDVCFVSGRVRTTHACPPAPAPRAAGVHSEGCAAGGTVLYLGPWRRAAAGGEVVTADAEVPDLHVNVLVVAVTQKTRREKYLSMSRLYPRITSISRAITFVLKSIILLETIQGRREGSKRSLGTSILYQVPCSSRFNAVKPLCEYRSVIGWINCPGISSLPPRGRFGFRGDCKKKRPPKEKKGEERGGRFLQLPGF